MNLNLLTRAELEVLQKVASGLPNKQIAYDLGKSIYTVRNQIFTTMNKLELPVRSRLHLALNYQSAIRERSSGIPTGDGKQARSR